MKQFMDTMNFVGGVKNFNSEVELKKEVIKKQDSVINGVIKIKALDSEDGSDSFKLQGYLSTYNNADRVGDVMLPGCFDNSIKSENEVCMLFNHNRSNVIGRMLLDTDEKGLFVTGLFDKDDEDSLNIYKKVKFGSLRKMSIGMKIKSYEVIDPEKPFGAWRIKEVEILEGSVVSVPANNEANITNVKTYTAEDLIDLVDKDNQIDDEVDQHDEENKEQCKQLADELRNLIKNNLGE